MARIEVTSNNALDTAEVVLTHIGEPAHFTRIGQIAANLGYSYLGTAQGGDLGTFLRVAMWNDTNGDEKAGKSRFARCANRVYRLKDQVAPENFDSKALVPRKGRVAHPTTQVPGNGQPMPTASGNSGRRPEPVAALVAIALNKPIQGDAERLIEEKANEDMKALEAETKAAIKANKNAEKVA
jgi:hypothetical protein